MLLRLESGPGVWLSLLSAISETGRRTGGALGADSVSRKEMKALARDWSRPVAAETSEEEVRGLRRSLEEAAGAAPPPENQPRSQVVLLEPSRPVF